MECAKAKSERVAKHEENNALAHPWILYSKWNTLVVT